MPTSPFGIAFVRGLGGAIITGGIAFLTTYQVAGSWPDAAVVGGIAFLTTLGTRFGIEGYVDTKRAGV